MVLVLGTNLIVRELGIGTPERAVILAESVSVRSAPAADDDLTVFEVHEGTRVRIDQRTDEGVGMPTQSAEDEARVRQAADTTLFRFSRLT